MANNFTPVGNEIQVNLAPNQDGDQFDPDIAALTDGRFFVAFDDDGGRQYHRPVRQSRRHALRQQYRYRYRRRRANRPAVAARSGGPRLWFGKMSSDRRHPIRNRLERRRRQRPADHSRWCRRYWTTLTLQPWPTAVRSWLPSSSTRASDIVFRFIDAAGKPRRRSGFHRQRRRRPKRSDGRRIRQQRARRLRGRRRRPATSRRASSTARALRPRSRLPTYRRHRIRPGRGRADRRPLHRRLGRRADRRHPGRFVSATGVPLGTAFAISTGGGFDFSRQSCRASRRRLHRHLEQRRGLVGDEVDADSDAVVARRFDSTGAPAGDLFLVNTGDPDTDQDNSAVAATPPARRSSPGKTITPSREQTTTRRHPWPSFPRDHRHRQRHRGRRSHPDLRPR